MKMITKFLIVSLIFIAGCSYSKHEQATAKQVVIKNNDKNKVEIQAVKKQNALQLVEKKAIKKTVSKKSPVIIKLMTDADKSIENGNLNVAVATLERAVRISPRDGEIFNKLAYVRFKQRRWGLAENLAKKSALLAEGNSALKKKNWLLISSIRAKKGDSQGAGSAMIKAKKYKL